MIILHQIDGGSDASGVLYSKDELDGYLIQRSPILLTENYTPIDIIVAPLFKEMNAGC